MSERLPKKNKVQYDTDAERFLAKYEGEVLGVLEDPAERNLIKHFSEDSSADLSINDEQRLANILEKFETKIFEYEKLDAKSGAKRVLVTSDNPGSWSAIKPLILALEQDSRCKGVVAIVSGVAGNQFKEVFPQFDQVRGNKTILGDAISIANKEPIDIIIASVSVKNGPESLALFGGKSNLGAAKTYFVFEGYGGVGSLSSFITKDQLEQIDGIFCNDIFAKTLIHKLLQEYPADRIYVVGTLSSEGFELDKSAEYRAETRAKLGIGTDAFAVLYLGDVNSDYAKMSGANPQINFETLQKTLGGIEQLAREEKERSVVLIVRPHPRDPDKEKLTHAGEGHNLPNNVSIKNGSNPISFNGAVYSSDVVVSIMSNENFFAHARGRRSIFLAYDDPGFGGQALQSVYGSDLIKAIKQMPGVFIASSPVELAKILKQISKESPVTPVVSSAIAASVLDTIFE